MLLALSVRIHSVHVISENGLSGSFNNLPRRLVYEAVLDVQQTLIRALKNNDDTSKTWTVDSLYYEMKRLFVPHLVNLGLIKEGDNFAVLSDILGDDQKS